MFENVTYEFYNDTLGRSVVPDEKVFNDLAFAEKAFVKSILPYIVERDVDGIDTAVCMMTEEAYTAMKSGTNGRIETSRSLDGFSQSFDISKVQSVENKKIDWLKRYCYLDIGVL